MNPMTRGTGVPTSPPRGSRHSRIESNVQAVSRSRSPAIPGMGPAIVDLVRNLIGESGIEIVEGAGSITRANRTREDRRFPIASTGTDQTGATAGRLALNSGEDEDGRIFGGGRDPRVPGRRARPAHGFATIRRAKARCCRRRPRANRLLPRAMSRGFPRPSRRGRRHHPHFESRPRCREPRHVGVHYNDRRGSDRTHR